MGYQELSISSITKILFFHPFYTNGALLKTCRGPLIEGGGFGLNDLKLNNCIAAEQYRLVFNHPR